MKKRLRIALIGVIAVLLGGIVVLVARSLQRQWRQEAAQGGLDLLPQVAQRIQDFHRIKTEDGRTVWEVAAREAQYHEDEHEFVVLEPLVRLYLKDGRPVGLSGHEGHVKLEGRELREVEVTGGIELRFADYTVRTDRARYQHGSDTISAPAPVEIKGGALELRGEQMEFEVKAQRLRLFRNVTMILRPVPSEETK
ncbi:MAG: LPS export ABC transporter periplasmic protein LptC [Deltaproteobacteria bacterium]|nr:LPS export ABC transporter periplasmic protein LptC [Deltaproteobacteria bacterium]